MEKRLLILGIRGIPATHGGFETFAEQLCLFLKDHGWSISVYCQEQGYGDTYESNWNGVRRIHIPISGNGAYSTIKFDLKACWHSMAENGLILALGYNTAVFHIIHRLTSRYVIINMDGIEWRRQKWGFVAKSWFFGNEIFGCLLGNHLVADHPVIKDHLRRWARESKITTIPYGAPSVTNANRDYITKYDLNENDYAVLIARPEPENSILEIVSAFSRKNRTKKLVVLGEFDKKIEYHSKVLSVASQNVLFLGPIYSQEIVGALRFYSSFYIHGHQVGGTNPSLVEALGAGCAVLAHDNQFNRGVAKDGALYFQDICSASDHMDRLFSDTVLREKLSGEASKRHAEAYMWSSVLEKYETLFLNKYIKGRCIL